ncbi:MAG: hypothetical protein JXQ75_23130 [Phycisphaerae bacterium]|nr:hypothetical protein [Phycisphaerae bacterium]
MTVTWKGLAELPEELHCRELVLSGTSISSVPSSMRVRDRLDLQDCIALRSLPEGLGVSSLNLRGCLGLEQLPPGLRANFLDLQGCVNLTSLPADLSVTIGRLSLRDCKQIHNIPASIGPLAQLDLAGCPDIEALPLALEVTSTLDIGGTKISAIPEPSRHAQILWRSVPIDERIAFRPETIAGHEILAERNAERRRVMLERVGTERFLQEVDAEVVDEDEDAGGPRKLLRVPLKGDEDLLVVSVRCPSTGRQYLLRVPPTISTCHAAVAWTAGFDDPKRYVPAVET